MLNRCNGDSFFALISWYIQMCWPLYMQVALLDGYFIEQLKLTDSNPWMCRSDVWSNTATCQWSIENGQHDNQTKMQQCFHFACFHELLINSAPSKIAWNSNWLPRVEGHLSFSFNTNLDSDMSIIIFHSFQRQTQKSNTSVSWFFCLVEVQPVDGIGEENP